MQIYILSGVLYFFCVCVCRFESLLSDLSINPEGLFLAQLIRKFTSDTYILLSLDFLNSSFIFIIKVTILIGMTMKKVILILPERGSKNVTLYIHDLLRLTSLQV